MVPRKWENKLYNQQPQIMFTKIKDFNNPTYWFIEISFSKFRKYW